MKRIASHKFSKNSFLLGKMNEDRNGTNYLKVPRDLYKYCSIETAHIILENQKIRFTIPSYFPDKREGNLYTCAKKSLLKGNIDNIDPKNDFYTCSFTTAKISEAFTQIYSAQALYAQIFGTDSMENYAPIKDVQEYIRKNSIGICFKFNRSKFKESLLKNLKSQFKEFKLYEGYMQYYSANHIDKITNEFLQNCEHTESHNSFYEFITCKNLNFKYEEEFRFYFEMSKPHTDINTIDLAINLNDCIDQIFVYMNSSCLNNDGCSLKILEKTKQDLIQKCNYLGINKRENANKKNDGELVKILNVNGHDMAEVQE